MDSNQRYPMNQPKEKGNEYEIKVRLFQPHIRCK